MGRKPTRWPNLPPGMRARPRGNLVHFYLDTGGKPRREIPLGSDYAAAVRKWSELTSRAAPEAVAGWTVAAVFKEYWKSVIPTKAPRTQRDNEAEREWLLKFFNDPPAQVDDVEPQHIRQYLDWRVVATRKAAEGRNADRRTRGLPSLPILPRSGQVRANREKALFSHMFNFARERGFTKKPNPCAGVHGFTEEGRDAYVEDSMIERVMAHAGKPLKLALRLAQVTGQRPGDVLRMSERDVSGGVLRVKQGKTKAKLRIVVVGELETLLEEIAEFKAAFASAGSTVRALALLVNEDGKTLTYSMLRNRFDDARESAGIPKNEFQFRDLRARAATDTDEAGGTKAAQALLGHTTETMTADYIRHKVGRKVVPFK